MIKLYYFDLDDFSYCVLLLVLERQPYWLEPCRDLSHKSFGYFGQPHVSFVGCDVFFPFLNLAEPQIQKDIK